jgi:hypothetical protein
MKYFNRHTIFWSLLLGTIGLVIFLGWGIINPPVALAGIRQLEEAPGQMVYQSRQNLKDQQGNTWQAIAFKRISPDNKVSVSLRLVGFPGVAEIDPAQPLSLTNSLGKSFTAIYDFGNILIDPASAPKTNIGQYDLEPILTHLQASIPLKLTLPTIQGEAIRLSIPPTLIEEWKSLASYQ